MLLNMDERGGEERDVMGDEDWQADSTGSKD
jgi:hypothetical protein